MARTKKSPKHVPGPAEVANDPSLRWFPYRQWELLQVDGRPEVLRFHHYTPEGRVVVASYAMGELPGDHDPLTVRRPSAGRPAPAPMTGEQKQAIVADRRLSAIERNS